MDNTYKMDQGRTTSKCTVKKEYPSQAIVTWRA